MCLIGTALGFSGAFVTAHTVDLVTGWLAAAFRATVGGRTKHSNQLFHADFSYSFALLPGLPCLGFGCGLVVFAGSLVSRSS